MSTWVRFRLARVDAVQRLSRVVNPLVRGAIPDDAPFWSQQALSALSDRGNLDDALAEHTRAVLTELASKPTRRQAATRGPEWASALVEALLFVDAVPAWSLEYPEETSGPTWITLCDGRDGNLYAELTNLVPGFEELATQGGTPVYDLAGLDDERSSELSEIAVSVATPAELAELLRSLDALAENPRFLVDLTWDRVEPVRARAAFARLRRLVRRAHESEGLTLAWQWIP